jgi:hypothetical protein
MNRYPLEKGFKETKLKIQACHVKILKTLSIHFFPDAPHSTRRDYIPNKIKILPAKPSIPKHQKLHHPSRHNPLYSKHSKGQVTKVSHNITMKEVSVNSPTLFTLTILIFHS